MRLELLLATMAGATVGAQMLGPTNPPWSPTWNMSMSTLTMACNSSGWYPSLPRGLLSPPLTLSMREPSDPLVILKYHLYTVRSSPTRGAAFGITSYDWYTHARARQHAHTHTHRHTRAHKSTGLRSNTKKQWAAAKPMDCEERLLEQARKTKNLNKDGKVFVYRNLVKALPW